MAVLGPTLQAWENTIDESEQELESVTDALKRQSINSLLPQLTRLAIKAGELGSSQLIGYEIKDVDAEEVTEVSGNLGFTQKQAKKNIKAESTGKSRKRRGNRKKNETESPPPELP